MAVDLTPLLPDLTAAQGHLSPEFLGIDLPALPAGCKYTRRLPAQCRTCDRRNKTHKVWERCEIDSTGAGGMRAVHAAMAARDNAMLDWILLARDFTHAMNRVRWGIYNNQAVNVGYANNAAQAFDLPVTSISGGNRFVFTIEVDGFNPANFGWNSADYNMTPDPGEGRVTVIPHASAAPADGIVTVTGSILVDHGGWVVRRIIYDPAGGVGDTWMLEVEGNLGAVMTLWPPESEGVVAHVTLYLVAPDGWFDVRKNFPMYCLARIASFTERPASDVYPLQTAGGGEARVMIPTVFPQHMQALKVTNTGSIEDITAEAAAGLSVLPTGATTWESKCDLAGYVDDAVLVTILFWHESTSAAARNMCQGICRNSIEDRSASHGVAGEGASTFYCRKANELIALGASGETILSGYRWNCYRTDCPYFNRDTFGGEVIQDAPSNPLNAGLWEQWFYGFTWLLRTYQGYSSVQLLERKGPPGLLGQCTALNTLPVGYHEKHEWPQNGGWEKLMFAAGEDWNFYYGLPGFEFGAFGSGLVWPAYGDPETWPGYGPAGGNAAARLTDYGNAALTDGTDPTKATRAMAISSSRDLAIYDGELAGGFLGAFTRVGHALYEWFFPRLEVRISGGEAYNDANTQHRVGGRFLMGYWTADFIQQSGADVGGPTVYRWRAWLDGGLKLDKSASDALKGTVRGVTVAREPAAIADGKLTIEPVNGIVTMSSWHAGIPFQTEQATTFRMRGQNVADPEFLRPHNYACDASRLGPSRDKIRVGHVCRFTDPAFAEFTAEQIWNRAFPIVAASAGSGGYQSPNPQTSTQQAKRLELPGAQFIPYGDPGESTVWDSIEHVTLSRNGGAQALTIDYWLPPKPYPTGGMALDHATVWEGRNEAGLKGLYILVSHLNSRMIAGIPDDEYSLISATVTTRRDGVEATYNELIETAPVASWSLGSSVSATAISGMVIRDNLGVSHELTAMASLPAQGADWTNPLEYFAERTGSGGTLADWQFWTHPQWGADSAIVTFATNAGALSDEDFIDGCVAIHGEYSGPGGGGSLIRDWRTGNIMFKGDTFQIVDENGVIAAARAAGMTINGRGLTIEAAPVLHHSDGAHTAKVYASAYINDGTGEPTAEINNLVGAEYQWTLSGQAGAETYYLRAAAGGAPDIGEPAQVLINLGLATKQTVIGDLALGQWAMGDLDLLGYNTLYVRTGVDPDSQAAHYVQGVYDGTAVVLVGNAAYRWTASGAEYFLELVAGGDPAWPNKPDVVEVDGVAATEGTAGALTAGQWGWGNVATGFPTVYYRPADAVDPDLKASGHIIAAVATTTPGSEMSDVLIFGADGEVWGQTLPAADACVIVRGYAADCQTQPRAADFLALRQIIERMMGE